MFNGVATSKLASRLLWLGAMLLIGVAFSPGQTTKSQLQDPGNDPFATYHTSLANTADKVLAASIQRPIEKVDPNKDRFPAAGAAEAAGPKISGPAGPINRVQGLRPIIEPILREERVPTELAAIVLVESGGQPDALSPKGARGIWQFMPDTARRYGLIVTAERDERLDIERSTRAAARYLRDLYSQFGDWKLAIAAYNAGGDLVQRAIQRNGTRDFSKLSSGSSIPLETTRYVPAVVAATNIFRKPNSAMVSTRNVSASWNVYADAKPIR